MSESEPLPQPRRTHVYLESRYRKLVRDLPQTIHFCPTCKGDRRGRVGCATCDGRGKISADSVQELISRTLLPAFRAKTGKFHGAGREDVDVRMLGNGRPFVFELVGVRRADLDLEALRAEIHERYGDRIRIDPFVVVPRSRVGFWKESKFEKLYRAKVACAAAPEPARIASLLGADVTIAQWTPQRVVRRRADVERQRRVVVVAASLLAPDVVELVLRCEHGTYVKEWVSGEDGRTKPALPDLIGVPAQCTELDVLEILTPSDRP